MNRMKKVLLVLCLLALTAATAFGTLAYFTDSKEVTNTFTVGKVGLELDEAKVNEQGEPQGTDRWKPTEGNESQTYHLLPGHSYTKDPTVTVTAGSERCYVRILLTIADCEDMADNVLGWLDIDDDWGKPKKLSDGTYEFRYKEAVEKSDDPTKLDALFKTLTVPGDSVGSAELEKLDDMKITAIAHAVQAATFDDADAAWAAFETQTKK